jgi:hypothetical protein
MFGTSQTKSQSQSYSSQTSTSNVGSTQQGSMLEYGRVPRSTPPSTK